MNVIVQDIVFTTPNYVFNADDFLTPDEQAALQSSGGEVVVDGDQYVKKSGDIMSGGLQVTSSVTANSFTLTNETGVAVLNFDEEADTPQINLDLQQPGSTFSIRTYSSSNSIRIFRFSSNGLDLGGARLLGSPSLPCRIFCRLVPLVENGAVYLRPLAYSGLYLNFNSPTSNTLCINRIGVAQFKISINMDVANIAVGQNLSGICPTFSGSYNGVGQGSNAMIISEYGSRIFVAAAGGAPNMIQMFFQTSRISAPTTLVDITSGGFIDISATFWDSGAIVT